MLNCLSNLISNPWHVKLREKEETQSTVVRDSDCPKKAKKKEIS